MSTGTRRIVTRICIALSAAMLLAVAVFPALGRRAPLGGLGICAAAAVSIACGLVYLRSAPRSCPGCVGRGTGEVCCLCGLPVPIALRRSPGDAPEYDPGCHGCASGLRHTHATVTR